VEVHQSVLGHATPAVAVPVAEAVELPGVARGVGGTLGPEHAAEDVRASTASDIADVETGLVPGRQRADLVRLPKLARIGRHFVPDEVLPADDGDHALRHGAPGPLRHERYDVVGNAMSLAGEPAERVLGPGAAVGNSLEPKEFNVAAVGCGA